MFIEKQKKITYLECVNTNAWACSLYACWTQTNKVKTFLGGIRK